jgi:hypothetical protein
MMCVLLMSTAPSLRAATTDALTTAPLQQALVMRVDGELSIDPQGVPIDYAIKTVLPQKLHDSLEQHVHSWRFVPVLIDGKPVLAETEMRVVLAAQGVGDAYRVTVDDVTFPQMQGQATDGDPKDPTDISYGKKLPINYPLEALQYGLLEASVMLDLKLTSEGQVEQAFVEQTALHNVEGKPRDLENVAQLFERAAVANMKSWRFNVVVNVLDPKPENLTVRVPVHFSAPGLAGAPTYRTGWQQEVRTPRRRAPWLPTGPTTGSIGVADSKLAPADRRFRLTAQVTGTTL